jgi:hypothetical protein
MPLVPLYDVTGHPLLSEQFNKLKTAEEKTAQMIMAHLLLNLRAPAFSGDEAEELGYAIVRQVNYQIQRGISPEVMKSISNTQPGITTTYRDRYLDPGAWAIVARVTGVATVGFSPTAPGV